MFEPALKAQETLSLRDGVRGATDKEGYTGLHSSKRLPPHPHESLCAGGKGGKDNRTFLSSLASGVKGRAGKRREHQEKRPLCTLKSTKREVWVLLWDNPGLS